jgi:ureidoglycolate hydrolase
MTAAPTRRVLTPQLATPASFAAFGQVILPAEDGVPFGPDDAQLDLAQGTPRFYAMRLRRRDSVFSRITRHRRVTQCLGAMLGTPWFIAVAPPDPSAERPDPGAIRGFLVTGDRFIMLRAGTWHAGPFLEGEVADFYNLELADTNLTDHQTCHLDREFGLEYAFG